MYPYPPDYCPPYHHFPPPGWGFHEPHHDMYLGYPPPPPPPKTNPPCNTLYVAGIDPLVTETDLVQIFSTVAGFKRLKINPKDTGVFAFVEYSDIQSSTQALYSLNGCSVGGSQIRVEFAKSKMGEKGKLFDHLHPRDEGAVSIDVK
eukprot:TRINITY_DN2155_c0_g1_i8.p1 TRINITY_DN2155_c0_g1~~TRINITY_DN2155_c0_g1_i8.p1  ORF type:complete len:147 (-),score=24.85 TRINITY_DN2155_c0_g1_i8:47-487(-)